MFSEDFEMTEKHPETLEFKSELRQVLEIITHSLYTHREVFLRELISNASDAIDRLRFRSLSDSSLVSSDPDWKIRLVPDRGAGTLTILDNGIGMSAAEAVENLGTIAKSGTKSFLKSLAEVDAKTRPELIGQFGVGFYSAFMVADRVTVVSKSAEAGHEAVQWESDGLGTFTVGPSEREARGTAVTLHLKEDAREFLDTWRLKQLVKQYSDFVEHPIVMEVERPAGEAGAEGSTTRVEETLNSQKALWLKSKSEVSEEDAASFYRQVSGDFEKPAKVIHYAGEGTTEFKVLLFIPSRMPLEMRFGETKVGPRLYIRRVLVMEHCEALLPPWLRFVKGVVDCPDLPLNVSRETVQKNPILDRIRKNVVKNVLRALEDLRRESAETFATFFRELGPVLKEGIARDAEHREAIADLLLFESVKTEAGKTTTLAEYVAAMPGEQSDIWTLSGESRPAIENAPVLEAFKAKGWDVLLLTDPIDEFVLPQLREYKGKLLKAADQDELPEAIAKQEETADEARFRPLLLAFASWIEGVKEVRLSQRLRQSASCLVAGEGAIGANMERILRRAGHAAEVPETGRILELNAHHPAVEALRAVHEKTPDDPRLKECSQLLYEQALIAEGSRVKDPAAMAGRINDLLVRDLGR
ncbi:MAG: Chaperone protein HtpG [Thermoanaerobaculia bacterium]|nr:Chaperone protein HtpG [Thermoanaerobaculia bacterium]